MRQRFVYLAWVSVCTCISGSANALPIFAGPVASSANAPFVGSKAINNAGVIVIPQGVSSYRWSPTLAPQRLSGPMVAGVEQPVAVGLINQAGVSVGAALQGGASSSIVAVRYPTGATTPTVLNGLSTIEDAQSIPNAINRSGVIVGSSDAASGQRAVRWNAGATAPTELAGLGGLAEAYVINDAGVAAGVAELIVGGQSRGLRAVRWAAGGTAVTELLPLSTSTTGFSDDFVADINAAGVAVGYSHRFNGDVDLGERAVRWNAGTNTVIELQSLGTSSDGFTSTAAVAVSLSGTAVGRAYKYAGEAALGMRPVRWSSTGGITELSTFNLNAGEFSFGHANAVNGLGAVAGAAADVDFVVRAALWLNGSTTPLDLNTLIPTGSGWTLNSVSSLTDTGFVAGLGTFDPGGGQTTYTRAYSMLVPQAGTYGRGDANLDAVINFDDLLLLAQSYGQANPTFRVDVADFNLDGVTDFTDLLALAQGYGSSQALSEASGFSVDFAADWALARSLIPEPTSILSISVGLLAARRRRV